ncbi:RNA-directed DNA polymerase [Stenotrophomonas sp.]|uniref:RNA-directed DNA polymerase n=1 Tax=Stenotrophomonas sp. TaxID=69392 RepID=UPI0028ADE0DA|nr:RNA-directed DNA polymerase [Stenotrophomonas sp.]
MESFSGWAGLRLSDMVVAYRKAKADAFFENTFPVAIKFAEYERDLHKNLSQLLDSLRNSKGMSSKDLLGRFRIVPKKLGYAPKDDCKPVGHIHYSDPKRNAEHIQRHSDIVPDFRVIGDFPVETHVISAIWMGFIGHKLDAALGSCCYGARLRRINQGSLANPDPMLDIGEFHSKAIGSFPPYFQAYQRWRSDGLDAIRSEVKAGREVVAASLDLKSYYHQIDPEFLKNKKFLKQLGVSLTSEEYKLHSSFCSFLSRWSKSAQEYVKSVTAGSNHPAGGLVIGLAATRVVSNVLLKFWDTLIQEKLTPIHYGRYVDDMFIVLRDGGAINSAGDFMEHLAQRVGVETLSEVKGEPGRWQIKGQWIGESKISLQADKQKLFILSGRAGLDLIDSIENDIGDLSSEHRLLPLPDDLEKSQAARVLTAAGIVGESADTLRRADGLTIRRLGWAMQLRHVETLARDLPKNEWKEQREKFYDFARDHVLRPDALFEHFNYVPRLVGFAISLGDWTDAEALVKVVVGSIDNIEQRSKATKKVGLNGVHRRATNKTWEGLRDSVEELLLDSLLKSLSPEILEGSSLPHAARSLAREILGSFGDSEEIAILEAATRIARADLAKQPYKRLIKKSSTGSMLSSLPVEGEEAMISALHEAGIIDRAVLSAFRAVVVEPGKQAGLPSKTTAMPYIFPTRPLSVAEISEAAPCCLDPALGDAGIARLAAFAETLRGVWIRKGIVEAASINQSGDEALKRRQINVGLSRKRTVRVAVPSIYVGDEEWSGTAAGKARLTRDRYTALAKVVNETLRLHPRPDYLILPELSLPLAWVESVSNRLLSAGISLVAGTEYRHGGGADVYSEAYLALTDDRLGFNASVRIWQPKVLPAVHEEFQLLSVHGKSWLEGGSRKIFEKPVYVHNGLFFGVMICSELQNSKQRVNFQGEVDSLFVLCWNQDLDTFSSLVDSASLDVHAYTVLVNNRKYGDSRVRSPARKAHMRDMARIRGGDNNFIVSVSLNLDSLRLFQSKAKRWPSDADNFKPVPEGFVMSARRKGAIK